MMLVRSNVSSAYQNERYPLLCNTQSLTSGALHYLGMLLSLVGAVLLLSKAHAKGYSPAEIASFAVYANSMLLLYTASGTYHTFYISKRAHRVLRKLDHCMIYLLVAGSYTPICFISLKGMPAGRILLLCVWTIALAGIVLKLFWVEAPRWLTTASYIALGWAALFAIGPLYQRLPRPGFVLLFVGGVLYTVGGICYGLKIPRIRRKWFGAHEFFHIMILLGSVCHFVMIYGFVA